jgi:hypothetical protein
VVKLGEEVIVVEAFVLRDTGITCWRIAALFKEKYPGVLRWSAGLIDSMLRSRVYIGQMRPEAKGADWIDAHPPIVPRDLFDRVQAKLDAARSDKGRLPNPESYASWFLHGLMTCGLCGASIRSAPYRPSKKSKVRFPRRTEHTGWYTCYRHFSSRGASGTAPGCVEKWPCLRNNEIHQEAVAKIKHRLEQLKELWGNPEVTARPEVKAKDFAAARRKIKAKLQRIGDGYADAVIDMREARRLREAAQDELAKLDGEEKRHKAQRGTHDDPAAVGLSLLSVAALGELWDRGEPSEQRELAELLSEKIELFPNGRVEFTWRGAPQHATDSGAPVLKRA